jgi:RNA polymerase sigma-70 factor (ECF subfamily)
MDPLIASFLEGCPLDGEPPAGLAPALAELVTRGRAAWPTLKLDSALFVRRQAARIATDERDDVGARIAALLPHAGDLFLAAACAEGVPDAAEELEAHYLRALPRQLARLRPDSAFLDEVKQQLSVRLLVASPEAPPRIADYAGRGPLSSWLRVVAMHTALGLRRARKDRPVDDAHDVEAHAGVAPDLELELLARRYRRALEAALRDAMAKLEGPARQLLRLHYVDGLTVDDLGERLGVGRSTAARRVAAARASVFAHARALLRERLGLSAATFESLARQLRSQIVISLNALLTRET